MMRAFNARMLRTLHGLHPGSQWDILRGVDAPEMPLCATYGDVLAAGAALEAGGFDACRHPVPAPGLDGPYDLMTIMRFSAGGGRDVILVRRLTPVGSLQRRPADRHHAAESGYSGPSNKRRRDG